MILSSRNFVAGLLGCAAVAGVIVACGSDNESKFNDGKVPTGFFSDASLYSEAGDDPNGTLYKDDPPPGYCGPDGGAGYDAGPPITGTADCPSDKNKPGCACPQPGVTAACWTGLRKNRDLGICHDGQTTCQRIDETTFEWGPCEGQVLPDPDAGGADGCNCFSVGLWKIANTAPCIWSDADGYYAYSTIGPNADGCTSDNHLARGQSETAPNPADADAGLDAGTPIPWSTDTLTTDCAGSFTLCYRIKVGDVNNPQTADCTLGESCIDVTYTQENVEQTLDPLPPWNSTDSTCAHKWEIDTPDTQSPGYGEMYVKGGETVRCDAISSVPNTDEFVFNRVQYCPKACRAGYSGPADPSTVADVCKQCQLKGQGSF